jgi:hypothetical protein
MAKKQISTIGIALVMFGAVLLLFGLAYAFIFSGAGGGTLPDDPNHPADQGTTNEYFRTTVDYNNVWGSNIKIVNIDRREDSPYSVAFAPLFLGLSAEHVYCEGTLYYADTNSIAKSTAKVDLGKMGGIGGLDTATASFAFSRVPRDYGYAFTVYCYDPAKLDEDTATSTISFEAGA